MLDTPVEYYTYFISNSLQFLYSAFFLCKFIPRTFVLFRYYIVNRIISWYYKRKIKSSHSRLNDLKKEKKRLLDEIMENETYKVAKDILEKYAPETLPEKNPIVSIIYVYVRAGAV